MNVIAPSMCTTERIDPRDVISSDGLEILNSVSQAPQFNRWLMDGLRPYIGNRVLEAGCGIGNLTAGLIGMERLVGVDMDGSYVARLRQRYANRPDCNFYQADLQHLGEHPELVHETFDTVLCVNVLEHVRDDCRTLRHFSNLLQPGGRVILLVPAHPWLYSKVDRTLGHFRRYTRSELRHKFENAGLVMDQLYGFNRLGAIGWFVSGKLLRARTLTTGQMRTYDRVLPLAKAMERVRFLPALSLVAIGSRPA